ncbi:MAG: right-handed parallel beta-helix repeat-containing protein [Acidobacteriaceae bacterium]
MKKTSQFGFMSAALITAWSTLLLFSGSPAKASSQVRQTPATHVEQHPAGKTVFFVSPRGNDQWSGKLDRPNAADTDGPFRTLVRARDAIRRLKAAGQHKSPVTVYLRGGIYQLKSPLVFTPQDSGTLNAPNIYEAYPGETPVLSGGVAISDWHRYRGTAVALPARNHVWTAQVPGVKQSEWYFHQLFVNSKRMIRARSPNRGFYYFDGLISTTAPAHFQFYGGDIHSPWAEEGGVEIVALQDWAEMRLPIQSVDEASHVVTLAGHSQPFTERNARYWVENTLDALDAPGEWYLDPKTGRVYLYPTSQQASSRAHVVASRLTQLILFQGDAAKDQTVSHIALRGLTFSFADWSQLKTGYADMQAAYDIPAAISGTGTRSCTIEKSRFIHLGGYAIAFGQGSQDNRIVENEMTDLGAGGVKIGDPKIPTDTQMETKGNQITDNHIHNIGLVYPAAVGVWIGQSSDNVVSHNEINDTYYTAISAGWTWGYGPTVARGNLIEFNNLYNIGRGMLSDMGCIYTLGVQPGTVERNNVCHDVSRYKYGGWGIYTDEGSSDISIEDNVVYRCEDGGFHQHYGEANVLRNNIFALGDVVQIRRSREENHLNFTFAHNIVYWKDGKLTDGTWHNNQFRFDNNIYYDVSEGEVQFSQWSFEDWQKRGQDLHSAIANPLFLDPERGDFSLDAASPALKMGFKPIDVSTVGPRDKTRR